MAGSEDGGGRKHWLMALAILLILMIVVPIIFRFY